MENTDNPNEHVSESMPLPPKRPPVEYTRQPPLITAPLNMETFKRFISVTGGSSLYCLSAVFVAYGIVKVLKPVLAGSDTIGQAMPSLLTLHVYELSLLGVLLLIVSRKVVDDAISLLLLMALFLVGTSIALGSVADRGIQASYFIGIAGIVLSFGKFGGLRRFAKIPIHYLSMAGLLILMACNYLGPVTLARSINLDPADVTGRRDLWLLIYLIMLVGAAAVIWDAMSRKPLSGDQSKNTSFLQSPSMVYVFALVILGASGVHQYTMAYAFTLERVMIDYVPFAAVGCLLGLEILRHLNKRTISSDIFIAAAPLALVMLAIHEESVLSSGTFGLGLLGYPPTLIAASAAGIAVLAVRHQWRHLWYVVCAYGLGIILTIGYSPEYPHALNWMACGGTLCLSLLIWGIVIWNPYLCFAGIVILCAGFGQSSLFFKYAQQYQITPVGAIAGAGGIGTILLYMLFKNKLHIALRLLGGLALSVFIYDYLPAAMHWRYIIAVVSLGLLIYLLWARLKDIILSLILCLPLLIRFYELTKQIAYWRFIILGFLLLLGGTFVSLYKRPVEKAVWSDEKAENL